MAGSTDFVPFATGVGANVTAQATYIAEPTTATGFQSGEASSADCNKVWRQATFIAAGIATFVANELNINVADNGNLAAFVTDLGNAISTLAAAECLPIAGGTLTGALAGTNATFSGNLVVDGTITSGGAASFNTSDACVKYDIRPLEDALQIVRKLQAAIFRRKGYDGEEAGVIAQQVQRVFPIAVREIAQANGEKRLGVSYDMLVAPLLGSVQALANDLDALRAQLRMPRRAPWWQRIWGFCR